MANIRINITANSQGATPALDDLARKLDSSMQYAAQRMAENFDRSISKMERSIDGMFTKATNSMSAWFTTFANNFSRIEQIVDRIQTKMGRLGALNGGAPAANQGPASNVLAMLQGFDPTGAYRQNVTAKGINSRIQYNNPVTGESAWVNDAMNRATFSQGPTELIKQRKAEQDAKAYAQSQAQLSQVMAIGALNRFRYGQDNLAAGNAARDIQSRQMSGLSSFNDLINQHGMSLTGSSQRYNARTGTTAMIDQYSGNNQTFMGRLLGRGYTEYSGSVNRNTGQFSFKDQEREAIGIAKAWSGAKDSVVAFAASIFSLQSIGGMVNKFLIQPFKEFISTIFAATDEYRKFENSISGVAGGQGRAREINTELLRASRNSPMTIQQLHQAGVGLTFTQYGASKVAGGNAGGAAGSMLEYATLLQQLSNLAPEQGVGGAQIAVREALAGNFQSARRRLNTSPELIAGSLQRPGGGSYTLADITGNQTLTMKAFQQFANTWIGQAPIEGQKNLFSNASDKLYDAGSQMAAGIGNAGVYDKIVNRFRAMADEIYKFIDSPKFKTFATKISDAMVSVFDSIADTILGFAQRVTGTNSIQDAMASLGDTAGMISDRIASVAANLPQIASTIGEFLRQVFTMFVETAKGIHGAVTDPGGTAAKSMMNSGMNYTSFMANKLSFGKIPQYNFTNSGWNMVGAGGGAGGSSIRMPEFNWQGISGLASPYAANRRSLDTIDSMKRVGNYQPMVMGMLNDVGDSAKLFQAMGGEGSAFSFPENPFRRAMNGATGVSSALAEKLAGSGSAGGALTYGAMLENARGVHSQFVSGNVGIQNLYNMQGRGGLIGSGAGMINGMLRNQFGGKFQANFMGAEKDAGGLVNAVTGLPGAAGTQFGMVAGSLAQQVGSLAPQIQASTLQKIMYNLDGVLDQFANALKLGPREKAELQKKFTESVAQHPDFFLGIERDANMANVTAKGTYGSYAAGKGFTNPTTSREMQRMQMGESFASASRFQRAADAEYSKNGATDLYASLTDSAAKDRWSGKKLEHDLNTALVALETFSGRARDSIENGIGEAMYGLITQTSSVSDAFKSMANSILKSFTEMSANMLMSGLFGPDFMKPGGGEGGMGLGGLGGLFGSIFGLNAKADGGVFPGSFVPFHAFSAGGIAHSPTMGLVAEAGSPEAIVPLPNGRSIPVEMRGGSSGGRTFVVQNESQARSMGYNPSRDDLVNIIADDIHRGGKIHKAMRAKMR